MGEVASPKSLDGGEKINSILNFCDSAEGIYDAFINPKYKVKRNTRKFTQNNRLEQNGFAKPRTPTLAKSAPARSSRTFTGVSSVTLLTCATTPSCKLDCAFFFLARTIWIQSSLAVENRSRIKQSLIKTFEYWKCFVVLCLMLPSYFI